MNNGTKSRRVDILRDIQCTTQSIIKQTLGTLLLLGLPIVAQASPVTWTIDIPEFTIIGGDTVKMAGSFDFDADLSAFSNIDISISGVTVTSPSYPYGPTPALNGQYDFAPIGSSAGLLLVNDINNNGIIDTGDAGLSLNFGTYPGLASTTGSTEITASGFGFCVTIYPGPTCGFYALGGSLGTATSSVVPLPPALALMISGLACISVLVMVTHSRQPQSRDCDDQFKLLA